MSKENPGGPAFPVICHDVSKTQVVESGMTIRDYFASSAMQCLMTSVRNNLAQHMDDRFPTNDVIAEASYRIADAMLKARNL